MLQNVSCLNMWARSSNLNSSVFNSYLTGFNSYPSRFNLQSHRCDHFVVATWIVNLPMPPRFSAFRIKVDSHYSLALQTLLFLSDGPTVVFSAFAISEFPLPPFSFVFPEHITDNCFRFYQYIIHLSKCYIEYFTK